MSVCDPPDVAEFLSSWTRQSTISEPSSVGVTDVEMLHEFPCVPLVVSRDELVAVHSRDEAAALYHSQLERVTDTVFAPVLGFSR